MAVNDVVLVISLGILLVVGQEWEHIGVAEDTPPIVQQKQRMVRPRTLCALIMRHWARHVSLKRSLYVANVKLLFV